MFCCCLFMKLDWQLRSTFNLSRHWDNTCLLAPTWVTRSLSLTLNISYLALALLCWCRKSSCILIHSLSHRLYPLFHSGGGTQQPVWFLQWWDGQSHHRGVYHRTHPLHFPCRPHPGLPLRQHCQGFQRYLTNYGILYPNSSLTSLLHSTSRWPY